MRRSAVLFIALLMLVVGCKKTEKGENQRWSNATKSVDQLKVLYPGFKQALTEQYSQAKAVRDQAEALSDEADRIKKMSEANNLLSSGLVPQLAAVDAKQKAIQAKIVEITTKAADKSDRAGAQQAAENAKRTMAQVDATLKKGAPDARSAAIIVGKVTTDLDAAERVLGTVASIAQQKQGAGQTAPAAGGTTGAGQTPAAGSTPPEAEKWTCEYCAHVNEPGHENCANCGSARPAKK
jgi:alanyl-tRNA synthetase